MMAHSLGAFYRRGSSITSQVYGQDEGRYADATPRASAPQREDCMITPPFTPTSRWSNDSLQGFNISQKLDQVLLMFEDLKKQVERDAVETREQISLLQEDLMELKAKQCHATPKARKRIPCEVSVRPSNFKVFSVCFFQACSSEGS